MVPNSKVVTPQHLSAASGLVVIGHYFYVIADDELHLGQFVVNSPNAGCWIPLFEGYLPHEKAAHKAKKPDIEALTLLPASKQYAYGALLAIGSGSKQNRQNAVIIPLDSNGNVAEKPYQFSLAALYQTLQQHFPDLNIEGACIKDNQLVLMQRANNQYRNSALIYCPLTTFLLLLDKPKPDFSKCLIIVEYTLPEIEGIPLGFTDGKVLANGNMIFTAAAENTNNSYNDGACVGSAIGIITAEGQLQSCHLLQEPYKIEGIAVHIQNNKENIWLVNDADNPLMPATLFNITHITTFS